MSQNMNNLSPCPCCGNLTLGEVGAYEICSICNWEDDPVQSAEPTYAGGANQVSLIDARQIYLNRAMHPPQGL